MSTESAMCGASAARGRDRKSLAIRRVWRCVVAVVVAATGLVAVGEARQVSAAPPVGALWAQLGNDIDGEAAGDQFGRSVATSGDGNSVVIGAIGNDGAGNIAGHVRIFDWDAGTGGWVQRGGDIDGEAAGDQSGWSVAMSGDGDTVIVGAIGNDGAGSAAGHVRIFDWDAGTGGWVQRGGDIDGEAAGDQSGWSVAMSGDSDTVIVGAIDNDGAGSAAGHARVFDWDAGTGGWVQRGGDIDGEAAGDASGWSVAMSGDGDTVVIGAYANDGAGSAGGHVRVFDWDAGTGGWVQRGGDIDGEAGGDQSGFSVAMSDDGDTVAIGAVGNDGAGNTAGHARIFDWDAGTTSWVQRGGDIDGEAAFDQSGFSVAMSGDGDAVAVGAIGNDGAGSYAGHVRILDWDAGTTGWVQRGGDIDGEATGDQSGRSVAMSGDGNTVIIGALDNDGTGTSAGHARVYRTVAWGQLGDDIDGEATGDKSGWSVAMSGDGNTVVVGAIDNDGAGSDAGHVRIFDRVAGTAGWVQRGGDIDGEAALDESGRSVAMSGDGNTVIVGAIGNDGAGNIAGHVRIFDWDAGTGGWVQRGGDIDGEAAGDQSGWSVAMSGDGDTVIVGAIDNDGAGFSAGHVRILDWDAGTGGWVQRGGDIDGEAAGDQFGYSVAMSGDGNTVIVGANANDGASLTAGHVRIFDWDAGTGGWVQRGGDIDGEAAGDQSGRSVAMSGDGNTVIIGANANDGAGTSAGHVWIFDWDAGTGGWVQRGGDIDGEAAGDASGWSVAMSGDGNTVIVGAIGNDGAGSDAGHVRIFDWDAGSTGWVQRGGDIDGEAVGDLSGGSVAMSGDGNTVIIGANANDGTGNSAGHARVYRFVPVESPAVATVVVATAPNPAAVELSWTPGPVVEGFALTGWRIERSVDAALTWNTVVADSGTATAASTVTGLTNGAAYLFRVSGISAAGVGQPAVSNIIVPTAAPTVTVASAVGQDDPTNQLPIEFTVTFDQDVTGFAAGDVAMTAPAGAVATVTAVSARVYTVGVDGSSVDGTVEVSVDAGAAVNANGQTNTASGSATVAFDTTGPVATIDLAPLQSAATATTPVAFSVHFDEAVTDFTLADVAVSGTAGASDVTLSGSGAVYVVTVGQAATSGTIVVDIDDGAATDALGNASSTVVDANTVTITDGAAPIISTPGATVDADTDPGKAFATVDFTVTATDPDSTVASSALTNDGTSAQFGGTLPVACTPASGSQFPIGATTVTCTATDATGNTATASFVVQVTDNEQPVIASPGDQTIQTGTTYSVATATDNSGTVAVACTPASGTSLPAGANTVTCTATDPSGNTSVVSFQVTVAAAPVTDLPVTGNSGLPWKPGVALIAVGLGLLGLGKRRRTTRVTAR